MPGTPSTGTRLRLEVPDRHALPCVPEIFAWAAESWAANRRRHRGVAGLADRPRPGRPAALSDEQRAEVAQWVQSGPDRKTDGVARWRCADLRDRIAAHFGIRMHERSVGKLLHALDFSSISVRPLHPQSDLEAQEAFKKTSPSWHAPRSRRSLPAGRLKSGFRMKPASASKAR
jgi:transposase